MQFYELNGENRAGNRSKLPSTSTVWMEPFLFRADLRRDNRRNNEARGAQVQELRGGEGNRSARCQISSHSPCEFRKIDADWTLSGCGKTSKMWRGMC